MVCLFVVHILSWLRADVSDHACNQSSINKKPIQALIILDFYRFDLTI